MEDDFDLIDIPFTNQMRIGTGAFAMSVNKTVGWTSKSGFFVTKEIPDGGTFKFKLHIDSESHPGDLYMILFAEKEGKAFATSYINAMQGNIWNTPYENSIPITTDNIEGVVVGRPNVEFNMKLEKDKEYLVAYDHGIASVMNPETFEVYFRMDSKTFDNAGYEFVNRVGFWGDPTSKCISFETTNVSNDTELYWGDLEGKMLQAIGDSLTFQSENPSYDGGHNILSVVKNRLKLHSVLNKGLGGTCLASVSGNNFCERYDRNEFMKGAQINYIWYGHNDQCLGCLIGEEDSVDTTTWNGALNVYMKKIHQEWDGRVVFVTPSAAEEGSYTDRHPEKSSIKDFRDALIRRCEEHNFPYIDFYSISQINKISQSKYCYDGIHHNAKGAEKVSKIFTHWLDIYGE